ncbi:MptD family putative ECF transporter S component [Vagococcus intermedius]|uniref:MptD family putative ECF transporter S component n=1 Tax=Vagococcus intermedius TaxID=2991418 RepID=A0AAF0I6L1_9ENTE|nr:MptD family putative ECF transporter S component [Vagococcus intermedius]WEG72466.1 MptD family putative ECF transporter S component [Vagococcus intermedius]WEG74553.1 MptD family putative ECF transporter S component [Vagococcus intermedius]
MKFTLKTKDLITAGVFAALYFVVVALVTFACMILLPGLGNLIIPTVVALIVGPIFYLLINRVPKFGAVTILSSVMGIFFMFSGHFPLSFIPNFVFGILADILLSSGKRTANRELAAFTVFNYGLIGPLVTLWFMKAKYVQSLVDRGKGADYINGLLKYVNWNIFIILMISILIASIIGGLYGKKMMAKHFSHARTIN